MRNLGLKLKSRVLSAIVAFCLLLLAEIIQLYTPKTFDPLDLAASAIGIGCAEIIRIMVEKKFNS